MATNSRNEPISVVVVGDTCISERGMASIVADDKRYFVSGSAHSFAGANTLIRKNPPELLLIEPFMQGTDGIRWIRELTKEFPQMRILVVSRQAEEMYAERALRAGAGGYWMKNSSIPNLMNAINIVLSGEIYVSPTITSLAVNQLAGRSKQGPNALNILSDRELAVFTLIASGHGNTLIANRLGISRKTVETHCEHIKHKLGYGNAEALKRGARESLGSLS